MKKWQQFEALAESIQRNLAPEAKITRKAKVLGRDSDTFREIDILVESKIGQFDFSVGIDCKDYNHPVDVGEVESVIGLFQDTRMNKGAIVAARGFSSTAKKLAESKGIELYKVVDTREHPWRSFVTASAIVHYVGVSAFSPNLSIQGTRERPASVRFQASLGLQIVQLYDKTGKFIDCVQNLIAEAWENGSIPRSGGTHKFAVVPDTSTFINTDGQLYPVSLTCDVSVEEKYFLGDLPLHDFQAFQDQQTGKFLFSSIPVPTVTITEIRKQMQEVASPDQLAVKPLFTYEALGSIPKIVVPSVSM